MNSATKPQIYLLGVLTAVILAGLLYILAPILTPFFAAIILAYMGDPVVDRLERWKLSRTLAVAVSFSFLMVAGLAFLLILIPLVGSQVSVLVEKFPQYYSWVIQQTESILRQYFNFQGEFTLFESLKSTVLSHLKETGALAGNLIGILSRSGLSFITSMATLLLIPVVTFYLLRDWDMILVKIQTLLPRSFAPKIMHITQECHEVLSAFFRGQLLVMFFLALVYGGGLWLVGLDFGILIGFFAGTVSFVPYLGFISGMLLAGLAAIIQFQDWPPVVLVVLVFALGQLLESFILTPWLVGNRIGLHPVMVIFAVLAGGQLFGFFGVLMALPIAAVILVLVRHLKQRYLNSTLYQRHDPTN